VVVVSGWQTPTVVVVVGCNVQKRGQIKIISAGSVFERNETEFK
jgi:hypothetical protein